MAAPQQPQSQMSKNKAALKAKTHQQGEQEFHTSTFGCTADCGLCLDVAFCTPCQLARVSAALNGQADDANWGCCIGLSIGLALGGWHFVAGGYSCCLRQKTREKYSITGSCPGDAVCAYFCWPCVVCQVHRQLQFEGVNPGSCCCSVTPVPPRQQEATAPFGGALAGLPFGDKVAATVQPGYQKKN